VTAPSTQPTTTTQQPPETSRRAARWIDPPLPPWAVFGITFIAYLAMARLGLLLAIQPGNASPLFPAAGVGLATAFVWGRWAVAAVAAAALAANLWHGSGNTVLNAAVVATWLGTSAGAALQAFVGARLVRRFVSQPLLLSEPADLARFMLMVVPLACVTSASVAMIVLLAGGTIGTAAVLPTWGAWWVGDTLGVLIGAPIVWAFIAAPREAWAPRRWAVALPLALGTAVMALGIMESMRAEEEAVQRAFQRDADNAVNALTLGLQEPLRALEAMRGLADAAPTLDRDAFRRSAAAWRVDAPGLAALGLSERVERTDIAAFEAREQASGMPTFRISERWPAGHMPAADDWLMAIRLVEPRQSNAAALGVNARSLSRAREAIAAATRSGRPAATAAFGLSQGGQGVVIYQALYRGEPTTAEERERTLRGVVFATLRPADLLRELGSRLPAALVLCLLDNDAPAAGRVLAGAEGCDGAAPSPQRRVASMPFAGRQWDLRVSSNAARSPGIGRTWPLALVSLASAAMLGALLLTITGRARRIEAAVQQRTAELQLRSSELQAEAAQRQRTAVALRESQQRLRNILDHAPIGVAYTDVEGRIREANPYLRELLGASAERLAGKPMVRLLHVDDRDAESAVREGLLAGETPMARAQLRFIAADDRVIATRASVSVLRSGKDNEPRRMVWVIEDITEHLALEDAQRARAGAEAANRAKSEFLSRMSHELRTPLNALLGFTQLLELDRKQRLAPHQLEWTVQMRQAGWHLLHMINDTLDLARIESGHVELEPRTLDLQELVEAALALVRQAADKRRVRLEAHLGTGMRAVIGDPTRVKQILTNLLSNAVKYNVEGGSVVVASRLADAGRIALDVIDTGSGMNPQQLAQLFQPFNRLGQESGPVEGTGIGLVISLRLAELMGGALHARSSIGMGSTFTLELPRAASAAAAPSRRADEEEVEPAEYRRRVIHYVEDNETNAEVMRGILALRPQVDLEVSALGLDGLGAIKRRQPSLVLLDMQLPDIDGLEVLRRLQADAETADIPVIVVSADATEGRISQALAAGAAHYLTKPVNIPMLLAAVDGALEQLDTHFG
jgi:PAS domain S-box-containing protein